VSLNLAFHFSPLVMDIKGKMSKWALLKTQSPCRRGTVARDHGRRVPPRHDAGAQRAAPGGRVRHRGPGTSKGRKGAGVGAVPGRTEACGGYIFSAGQFGWAGARLLRLVPECAKPTFNLSQVARRSPTFQIKFEKKLRRNPVALQMTEFRMLSTSLKQL
jgi:hypothetical protein